MLTQWIDECESLAPLAALALFFAASFLMIWRLERMSQRGFEGTVVGTLVMPYCSGMGNLLFVWVLARSGEPSQEIVINALVNNVTNVTLLLGIPALIWGMAIVRGKKGTKAQRIDRLSLLLTLTAALFFSFVLWALARDGRLGLGDGLVLIGMFAFWQAFSVFEVLKTNVRKSRKMSVMMAVDGALLAIGSFALYISIDWLTIWVSHADFGILRAENLGRLSGWLMVLPNALLAFYYAWKKNADVVYSSQLGDAHICIPLCVGLFACLQTVALPHFFATAMLILCGVTGIHLFFVAFFGKLPRFMGWVLIAAYGVFHWMCFGTGS